MPKASYWYVSVSACCVLQETHVAMAVVAVEAWRPVLPTSWFSLIRCKPYAHVRLTEPLTTLSSTCGSFVGFSVSTRYLGIPSDYRRPFHWFFPRPVLKSRAAHLPPAWPLRDKASLPRQP